jgi:hypothetical protein
MVKSALAADASHGLRYSSVTYCKYAPPSRLAIRAPRPRSSTDLTIRGRSGRERFGARKALLDDLHELGVAFGLGTAPKTERFFAAA